MNRLRNKIYLGLIVLAFSSSPSIIAMERDNLVTSNEMREGAYSDDDGGGREIGCLSRALVIAQDVWEAANEFTAQMLGLDDDEDDKEE